MNIIIVGCGRIGSTLVEELSGENHDISIIDEKARSPRLRSDSDTSYILRRHRL